MAAVRIVVLLVAASFVCVALRANRPEMAVAVSVAAGVAALLLSLEDIRTAAGLVGDLATRAEFAPGRAIAPFARGRAFAAGRIWGGDLPGFRGSGACRAH